jgi:hypothetical protein
MHCGMPLPQMRFLARFFSCTPFSDWVSALEPSVRHPRDRCNADHKSAKDGGSDQRLAGLVTLEQAVQCASRGNYAEKVNLLDSAVSQQRRIKILFLMALAIQPLSKAVRPKAQLSSSA